MRDGIYKGIYLGVNFVSMREACSRKIVAMTFNKCLPYN